MGLSATSYRGGMPSHPAPHLRGCTLARTRSIKPGFFKNETLAALPYQDRILFAGLWCIADREGRLEDRPKRIQIEVFPYDPDLDVEISLLRLIEGGFILRYEVDGSRYILLPTFKKHQHVHVNEQASTYPAPYKHGASTVLARPSTLPPLIPSTLNPENPVRPEFDDQWQDFRRQYSATGKPLLEEDFTKAHFLWAVMDFEQRSAAIAGIEVRQSAGQWDDANFIPLPEKYLRGEYKRGVIPRVNRTARPVGRNAAQRSAVDSAELRALEEEAAPWITQNPGKDVNDFVDWKLRESVN